MEETGSGGAKDDNSCVKSMALLLGRILDLVLVLVLALVDLAPLLAGGEAMTDVCCLGCGGGGGIRMESISMRITSCC